MTKLFIPIVLGTAREGRQSEKVANYVLQYLQANYKEVEFQLVDVRDFHFEKTCREIEKNAGCLPWQKIMERADGLLIVSPEYNHGYPGELKMFLDSLSKEYARKPVAICGVSSGPIGGARMINMLRPTLVALQLVPIHKSVNFSHVEKLFDAEGKILDDSYDKKLKILFDELVWFAHTLRVGREASVLQ